MNAVVSFKRHQPFYFLLLKFCVICMVCNRILNLSISAYIQIVFTAIENPIRHMCRRIDILETAVLVTFKTT